MYKDHIENKVHGSSEFPIQYYNVDSGHPEYIMPIHWHRQFEIVRVVSGALNMYINTVEYRLNAGDSLLVQCGKLHRGEPQNCIYECVVFDLNMLRKHSGDITGTFILPIMNGTKSIRPELISGASQLCGIIEHLFELMRLPVKYYELSVYSALFELFYMLYCEKRIIQAKESEQNRQRIKALTELIDWIEANYTEQITLQKLSAVSGMSEKYLCRFFKEFTSKTLFGYINEMRIDSACREILGGDRSITEAAFDSGFNNLSYFSKTFKRYKGCTPREYIKAHW